MPSRRMSWAAADLLLTVIAVSGCGGMHRAASRISVRATQWPQADVLFHRDPRWLGSDADYSVPMHDGRILWLFNDTLVAVTPAHVRSAAAFVRNTVAIERGNNPVDATMRFYWRSGRGAPASYFPEEGNRWFWPQHGIRLGRSLVVFLDRVRLNPHGPPGFNFEGNGWRLAVIRNASASPARWRLRMVTPPAALETLDTGKAVNRIGRYVVSLALGSRGVGYLVRWPARDLARGRLDRAQWWTGSGWSSAYAPRSAPAPITRHAGPECSLTFDGKLDRWVLVRSEGFGATTIAVSFARSIEGPFSNQLIVFRPPESDSPNPNVYAAKGHPELTGADLAVTYATKTYPRFVRLALARR